jgi:hypothetical protein
MSSLGLQVAMAAVRRRSGWRDRCHLIPPPPFSPAGSPVQGILSAAELGVDEATQGATYRALLALHTRDITPEDYAVLGELDSAVRRSAPLSNKQTNKQDPALRPGRGDGCS